MKQKTVKVKVLNPRGLPKGVPALSVRDRHYEPGETLTLPADAVAELAGLVKEVSDGED